VEQSLSYQARRALLQQTVPQYREASPSHKKTLVDAFVAATGYHRTYARWLLNHAEEVQQTLQRPRPPQYGPEVQHALFLVWHAANRICAKRLIPFLPILIESLERHEHLQISEKCRRQLLAMSAATADRLLASQRKLGQRGLSTTRAGTLLKQQIPIRTFEEWKETRPGFLEADLVAHCGTDIEGGYLYTLTLTDVATGWTECLPLLYRSQETVLAALQQARLLFPFPILGIDTDSGGEFINEAVIAYCEQAHITFTRGRPYLKNDQCFVEQKNGAIVRQVVGYDRLVGEHAYRQLTELYRALRLYVNCCRAFDEVAVETTGWEKSALRLRSSENSTPTTVPLRRPACQ
jgi:Integrase core domain